MSQIIHVGVVGLGKMGRVRLAALQEHPHLKPVACCDIDEANLIAAPQELHRARDYRELLARDLDAIFVCTPNRDTPQVVIQALTAGKHVFCEKPPGRTLDDIYAIIAEERRHDNAVLQFGFNHRYHPAVKEAKAIIDSGRLGEVLWVRGVYGKSGGAGFEQSWRSKKEVAGGGILLDQGIHMLDLFRYFGGEFDEIKSCVTRSHWKQTDVEDNAFALLRNSRDQRVAMLHSSSTHWRHTFLLDIFLSDGYVTINGIVTGTRSYGRETLIVGRRQAVDDRQPLRNPREEMVSFDHDNSWQLELDEFAGAILSGRQVARGSSQDALRAMELVFKIYAADEQWSRSEGLSPCAV